AGLWHYRSSTLRCAGSIRRAMGLTARSLFFVQCKIDLKRPDMKRRHGLLVATAATMMIWSGISAARADSCKSLAAEVAGTIDDFKIGRHVSNAIYIEHPQFRRGLFGCTSH